MSGLIGYFDVVMTQSGTAGAVGFGASNTDGQTRNFAVSGPSEKFAIKDA